MAAIEQQIIDHLRRLSSSQQQQVLSYVRSLEPDRPRGTSPDVLKGFIGAIPAEDLDRMEAAIESDLEKVDPDVW
ncbi:MAG: hypothetical protein JXJ17_17030 [Anaerolineae bacterium]|nr:hypothetical protein [Anaerolineae bacterium]